jgi:spore germination protein GerM
MVGNERQVLARIYVTADSVEELAKVSIDIRSRLRVLNELGEDMIVDWVDPRALL